MEPRTACTALLCVTAWAFGCGGHFPPPNDQWAAAQADVGRAEAAGAPAVPDAKLQLQLAQEDLAKSKSLMGDDNERAASLCSVASAEAQLALALTEQAKAEERVRSAVAEMQKGVTR
jgi:hypothetical protein